MLEIAVGVMLGIVGAAVLVRWLMPIASFLIVVVVISLFLVFVAVVVALLIEFPKALGVTTAFGGLGLLCVLTWIPKWWADWRSKASREGQG